MPKIVKQIPPAFFHLGLTCLHVHSKCEPVKGSPLPSVSPSLHMYSVSTNPKYKLTTYKARAFRVIIKFAIKHLYAESHSYYYQ